MYPTNISVEPIYGYYMGIIYNIYLIHYNYKIFKIGKIQI